MRWLPRGHGPRGASGGACLGLELGAVERGQRAKTAVDRNVFQRDHLRLFALNTGRAHIRRRAQADTLSRTLDARERMRKHDESTIARACGQGQQGQLSSVLPAHLRVVVRELERGFEELPRGHLVPEGVTRRRRSAHNHATPCCSITCKLPRGHSDGAWEPRSSGPQHRHAR
jgi:hypothetical protein